MRTEAEIRECLKNDQLIINDAMLKLHDDHAAALWIMHQKALEWVLEEPKKEKKS